MAERQRRRLRPSSWSTTRSGPSGPFAGLLGRRCHLDAVRDGQHVVLEGVLHRQHASPAPSCVSLTEALRASAAKGSRSAMRGPERQRFDIKLVQRHHGVPQAGPNKPEAALITSPVKRYSVVLRGPKSTASRNTDPRAPPPHFTAR